MKPTPPPAEPEKTVSVPGLPPLVWRSLPFVPGRPPFGVLVLADPDALLDSMDDESFSASDERMPYYALLWPSGLALAYAVAADDSWRGKRVLDLGCGVGAEGLAAARLGAEVTYLDWAPEAAVLVALTAKRLGLAAPRCVTADWRTPPADLGRFDLVLAADVLYEARNAKPVAAFLAQHLAPRGEAWLADPGRLHARDFPAIAQEAGLSVVEVRRLASPEPEATISLLRVRPE